MAEAYFTRYGNQKYQRAIYFLIPEILSEINTETLEKTRFYFFLDWTTQTIKRDDNNVIFLFDINFQRGIKESVYLLHAQFRAELVF